MRKLLILCLILLTGSLVLLVWVLFVKDDIKCELNGKEKQSVEVFSKYNEKGIKITNRGKVLSKDKYTLKIKGKVITDKLGDNDIIYIVKYHKKKYTLKRVVSVIDSTPPIISTNIEAVTKDVCTKKEIQELTFSAEDNYDKDLNEKIERKDTEEEINLSVSDSSGNISTKKLKIVYTEKPKNIFSLNGKNIIYVPINTKYNEKGAIYKDGCGEPLQANIKTTGNVNTSVIGDYTVKYTLEDGESLKRTVKVYDPNIPNEKIIYLTFDDGPGNTTKKILDALAKYNIKATFFVTNQFPSYRNLIKEEYINGHAVGVHSYTHKYDIYKSLDSYLNDFNKMNEIIKEETGTYSQIFRFPGGASNTISKSYKKGVVSEIAKYLTAKGYLYFDWNVDSTDAAGAGTEAIIKRVTTDVSKCSKCVVLMHDIKTTTANAIDPILAELTSRGYSFQVLNSDGPKVQHKIAN